MRARFVAAVLAAAALAAAGGCKSQAGTVNLTLVADASLSDATVAAIGVLDVHVSGAAATSQSYLVDQPFASGRQERLSIRTSVSSGTLDITVMARAAAGTPLAYGETMVTLKAEPVSAQLVLTGDLPASGDMGVDAGGSDGAVPGPSVQLVAGHIGGMGSADGVGAAARFNNPRALAYDNGSLYVTDQRNYSIRKIDVATGAVTTLAGSALSPGSTDGIGAAARFDHPFGLAADGAGNLYVADMDNDTIRKIVIATGAVSTIAGTTDAAGSTDANGANARFNHPHGMVWDGAGSLYIVDGGNFTIRKLDVASGDVTTVAGTAGSRGSTDAPMGPGSTARFSSTHALAFHNGNLYVADTRNQTIRQIVVATGVVTTLAGTAPSGGYTDAVGAAARFSKPKGIVADGKGTLYVADTDNNRLRAVAEADGTTTTLAGHDYGSLDGAGVGAHFAGPMALAYDGAGNLYCADGWGHTIRKVAIAGAVVTTLAGAAGGDGLMDGVGAAALFMRPHGIAVDGTTVWVADMQSHVIRKIDLATNRVSTLAGSGQAGSADGVAAAAQFNNPYAVLSDGAGTLYVADGGNDTIRKIDVATATVSTLAGTAQQTGGTDATGAAARFNGPAALALSGGTLYVADRNNQTIRAVDVASGAVTTLAGSAGAQGSTDGTGSAARFKNPMGLALDQSGNLYVADASNSTIRKIVVATGAVTTLSGKPGSSGSADGDAATARFYMPHALALDGMGNLLVADARNHAVRKVSPSTGAVTTWAGNPAIGAVQLGALPAALNTPVGLAVGSDGAVYVATAHENAILVIK